jgi:hypothetical protein
MFYDENKRNALAAGISWLPADDLPDHLFFQPVMNLFHMEAITCTNKESLFVKVLILLRGKRCFNKIGDVLFTIVLCYGSSF